MASRRPRAPSSRWFAAILSAGVPAESNCERACAISPNTVCSCLAIPFTVSTRFGIRSARRCSTTSTCDQADLTASFLATSVFFTLTYLPNESRIKTTMVISTIIALLMVSPQNLRSQHYQTKKKLDGSWANREGTAFSRIEKSIWQFLRHDWKSCPSQSLTLSEFLQALKTHIFRSDE